nr:SLATT domain-containing protein [Pseudomonas fragi]
MVQRWIKRSRESQFAHYYMADILSGRNRSLGLTIIVLTSLTGITSIVSKPPENLLIVLGLASLIAAFFTSLQTFFKYEERATSHLSAGAKYAAIRRKLELIFSAGTTPDNTLLDELRKELDSLAENSPNVPKAIFKKAIIKDIA